MSRGARRNFCALAARCACADPTRCAVLHWSTAVGYTVCSSAFPCFPEVLDVRATKAPQAVAGVGPRLPHIGRVTHRRLTSTGTEMALACAQRLGSRMLFFFSRLHPLRVPAAQPEPAQRTCTCAHVATVARARTIADRVHDSDLVFYVGGALRPIFFMCTLG